LGGVKIGTMVLTTLALGLFDQSMTIFCELINSSSAAAPRHPRDLIV
jgi:hypothetical protein